MYSVMCINEEQSCLRYAVQEHRYTQNVWVFKTESCHLKRSPKEQHFCISMSSPEPLSQVTGAHPPLVWALSWMLWR